MWMNGFRHSGEGRFERFTRTATSNRSYGRCEAVADVGNLNSVSADASDERAKTMVTTATQNVNDTMAAERFWRRAGVTGMIIGMASLIAATVIQWFAQPAEPSATPIDVAQQNPTLWLVIGLLGVFGPLAWVAGIVSITLLVRAKGWTLTTIGGYITGAGLIAGVGHLALFFGVISDAAGSGIDTDSGVALLRVDDASILSTVLLYAFLIGFSVGPILLAVGLRQAKLLPVWVPVAAVIMVVANFVGGIPAGIVQLIAVMATFGPMVLVLVRHREIGA